MKILLLAILSIYLGITMFGIISALPIWVVILGILVIMKIIQSLN